jgi:hypothetical protein
VVFLGSSTNKNDRHDIAEILLKVALNTVTLALAIFDAKSAIPLEHLPSFIQSFQFSTIVCCFFVSIMLHVLRFLVSIYPFDIFKRFLCKQHHLCIPSLMNSAIYTSVNGSTLTP